MMKKWLPIFYTGIFVVLLFYILVVPSTAAPPFSGLEWVSTEGTSGSIARVPLVLSGVTEPISELDLLLAYNPSLLSVEEILKGELPSNATFKVATDPGIIELTIRDTGGFNRDGEIAIVRFKVLASSGYSPLLITHLSAKAAATRSAIYLQKKEGTLTIIPGLSFSTSSAGQRIAVDTSISGSAVTINGPRIIFAREGITFTVTTEGIGGTAPRFTGLVKEVTGAMGPINGTFSGGTIFVVLSVTTPTYLSEGSISAILEGTVPPEMENQFSLAVQRARLNVSTILFTVTTRFDGFPATSPGTAFFTLPDSALSPSSNESLYVGYLKTDGTVEFTHPEIQRQPDQKTITFGVPLKQGSPSLVIVSAREIERPPVTAIPRTTGGNVFSEGGEAASGSIWIGMIAIFFLVAVVVGGVFYVHRKRGG